MLKAIMAFLSLVAFGCVEVANAQTSVTGSGTGIVTGGGISFDDAQNGGQVSADLTGHAVSVNFNFDFVDHVLSAAQFFVSVEDVPLVTTYSINGAVDLFSDFSFFTFAGDPTGGSAQIFYSAFVTDSFYAWDGIFSRLGNGHYTLAGGSNAYENLASPLGGDISFSIQYSISDAQVIFLGVPEAGSWAMLILGFGLAGSAMRRRRELRYSAVASAI